MGPTRLSFSVNRDAEYSSGARPGPDTNFSAEKDILSTNHDFTCPLGKG